MGAVRRRRGHRINGHRVAATDCREVLGVGQHRPVAQPADVIVLFNNIIIGAGADHVVTDRARHGGTDRAPRSASLSELTATELGSRSACLLYTSPSPRDS